MWPRLLEAPKAEETSLICGTAGKGPPAWDAGVTCPAFHLQVKSFQCRHRHLSLTTTWRSQENKKHIYGDIKALHVHRAYLFVKVYLEYDAIKTAVNTSRTFRYLINPCRYFKPHKKYTLDYYYPCQLINVTIMHSNISRHISMCMS